MHPRQQRSLNVLFAEGAQRTLSEAGRTRARQPGVWLLVIGADISIVHVPQKPCKASKRTNARRLSYPFSVAVLRTIS